MARRLVARQVGLSLVAAGMLSDRRTSGHGRREPLLVGERGLTDRYGVSKELEEDALKNIRDKLGSFGNIFARECSFFTGVFSLVEKARLGTSCSFEVRRGNDSIDDVTRLLSLFLQLIAWLREGFDQSGARIRSGVSRSYSAVLFERAASCRFRAFLLLQFSNKRYVLSSASPPE